MIHSRCQTKRASDISSEGNGMIDDQRSEPDPWEDGTEIYEEFGDRDFGGVYFTVFADGEFLRFERTPGGITYQISDHEYATTLDEWNKDMAEEA